MDSAFVKFGHGYETGSRGRCDAFDGFDILAAPLGGFDTAARDSRSFPGREGGPGVTYGSHAIKLACREGERGKNRDLFILMHHGAGREVLRIPTFYDRGEMERTVYHLPERVQYALLYSIWQAAANARREAERQTSTRYAQAFVEGRLKKRRRDRRVYVEIEAAPAPVAAAEGERREMTI